LPLGQSHNHVVGPEILYRVASIVQESGSGEMM